MLSPFSCGFFHPETSDDYDEPIVANSPCSTPRRSSSRRSGGFIHRIHHHGNKDSSSSKNPYATRGLDKFSALVADLEEKRQQIYAQTGSENDTFVRFVYKDSNDNVPVPIVLKLKDNKKQEEINQQSKKKPSNNIHQQAAGEDKMTALPSVTQAKEEVVSIGQEAKSAKVENSKKGNKMCDMLSEVNFRRPSFYLPVVVVVILVLLAVFGRSVAILCTSIGWYAIPTFKESHVNVVATKRRRTSNSKAKEHVKKSSENNNKMSSASELLTSPRSDVSNSSTPRYRKHDHRKSW